MGGGHAGATVYGFFSRIYRIESPGGATGPNDLAFIGNYAKAGPNSQECDGDDIRFAKFHYVIHKATVMRTKVVA